MSEEIWCRCGSCKKPILFNDKYFFCSVSTCRKQAYCSMPCFDDHSPIFRHKDAWAEERKAPYEIEKISKPRGKEEETINVPKDVLVVASKLKDYIKKKSGLNTSANVLERLSDMIRLQCDKGIQRAKEDNRKTVMDRDFY